MIFNEYGDKNNKGFVLIHAGGLSDWMFLKHIESLKDDYFLIVPIIDGHANDTCEFTSIESSANKLLAYIKENFADKDFYIYGISLGAQIAMQMIASCPDMFSKAIIESCLMHPQKMLLQLMLPTISFTYPLISKRWFSKIQARALYLPDTLVEKYFNDSKKISKKSLMNITKSNMMFDIGTDNRGIFTDVLLVYGSKEIDIMKKSAIEIHHILPKSSIKVIKNMHHGEIFFSNPNRHIAYLYEFIKE